MRPTPRAALLFYFACAVSALAAGWRVAEWAAYAIDTLAVLAIGFDMWRIPKNRIRVERDIPDVLSLGRVQEVWLRLVSEGQGNLHVEVNDDFPENTERKGLPSHLELRSGERASLRYELRPTVRGEMRFAKTHVRVFGPLGLSSSVFALPTPAELRVYPDVHGARALALTERRRGRDAALGSLRSRRGDDELSLLRPYVDGDPIKRIDWRASARRDEPVTRELDAQTEDTIVFAIDMGRSMRGMSGGLHTLDHTLNAAMLLAHTASRMGDKVGLCAFDTELRAWVPPARGSKGPRSIAARAFGLQPSHAPVDYERLADHLLRHLSGRALIVLCTNVVDAETGDEMARAITRLRKRHVVLCLAMQDADVEQLIDAKLPGADELGVRAAAAESLLERASRLHALAHRGVLVVDVPKADAAPALVRKYMVARAKRLMG